MSQDFAHAFDKLAVVGLGHVGELVVAASTMTNRFEEIHIYNRDSRLVNQRTKSDAKLRNLTDASVWYDTRIIRCDSYHDLPPDALTVICIKEGYDYRYVPPKRMREVTSRKDAPLMRKIAEAYAAKHFTGEILMVSNPIGPMAYLFQNYSGINASRIHPVGTILDTARYVKFIRKYLGNPSADVDAIAVGEHGPTVVFLKSRARVDGELLTSYGLDFDALEKETMLEGIIEARTLGYTNAGIVASLLRLFDILSLESHATIFPFGLYHDGVFVELPVMKSGGKYRILWDDFDKREKELLEASIAKLQEDNQKVLRDATERQRRKAIIVDDEPGEAESLAMALQECILDDEALSALNDFEFAIVHSGEGFVELIEAESIGYDLAIVDQRMPGMSGLDAILKAREFQPDLDCMILSGKSEMGDLQRMVNSDGLRFVEKPFFDPGVFDLLEQSNYLILKKMLERTQQKIA
jgi:malate/lactate dehydrogenase/FixJ family two-component response regulator